VLSLKKELNYYVVMNMSVLEIIKLGRKYVAMWPNRPELAQYFTAYRSVQVTRYVCRYMPALAASTFVLQLYFGSISALPQAIVYTLFMLSMPVQALVMSGLKADKFLPPSLASWYKEGVAKVNESGGDIELSVHKPRYMDLASLLNLTYQKRNQ